MKKIFFIPMIIAILFLVACGPQAPACPQVTGTPLYLTIPPEEIPAPIAASVPIQVEIDGRTILVDQVVEGPLCNGNWSGTVYVTCNVQVYPWEEHPTFLKDCHLSIAPNTVVYVADHYDTAYYNGCSCHTGEITGP